MIRFIRFFNEHFGFPLRRKYLVKRILPLLPDSGTVLDLGCSDGRLAMEFMLKKPGLIITGADTLIQDDCKIAVTRLTGIPYPFPDGHFDCVLLIDVLHHAEDPEPILSEAMRISRKKLIIKDHYYTSRFSHFLLRISDYWGNKPYGIPLPYHFLKPGEWTALFSKLNIRTETISRFRYNLIDPCWHILFVSEKP
jgi:SAM-dependent methyltransferase